MLAMASSPKASKWLLFFRMIKFEHSIFALPFAYLGFFLASPFEFHLDAFLWVSLAMVSFRTMAMGLNRLIDHSIDALNPRTRLRELPAQLLNRSYVWGWTLASLGIFLFTCFNLNPLCLQLAAVPIFLAVLYPFTKRFTWFSHLVLGSVLGIAPYGAWVAAGQEFSWIPGLISLGVTFWVAGFDMIYALQDMEFDQKQGLFSFPAAFGLSTTLMVTRALHLLTLGCWIGAGLLANLGWIYFAGIVGVSFFLIREHWLVRSFGLQKMNEAFFTMNAFVSVAVLVSVCADVWILGGAR